MAHVEVVALRPRGGNLTQESQPGGKQGRAAMTGGERSRPAKPGGEPPHREARWRESRDGREARLREKRFIDFPHVLYADTPQWVPNFRRGIRRALRRELAFFTHSTGEFFLALRDGEPAGTLGVFENRRYNEQHGTSHANFYYFDARNDEEAVDALFHAAAAWARERGLTRLTGPQLFGGASGHGILVDGFEHRAAMTMMRYNFPYYGEQLERLGFEKKLDLYSARLDAESFVLPDKVSRVADRVRARGRFGVMRFRNRNQLRRIAHEVADLYNDTLAGHEQNYRMTDEELAEMIDDVVSATEPSLVKALAYDGAVVGYVLAFPDISEAIRRSGGRLTPWTVFDLMREKLRTRSLIINGAGVLPQYQRLGGTALLYSELERTAGHGRFSAVELTQVAETTELMLRDLETLGAERYKTHRVYTMPL